MRIRAPGVSPERNEALGGHHSVDPLGVGLRAIEPSRSMTEGLVQCVDRRLEAVVEVRCIVADLAQLEAVLDLDCDTA